MNIPLLGPGGRKEEERLNPQVLRRKTKENRLWLQKLMTPVIRSGTGDDYIKHYAPGQPDRTVPKEGTLFRG